MNRCVIFSLLVFLLCHTSLRADQASPSQSIRVATFNVSIEASNYLSRKEITDQPNKASIVSELLLSGENQQQKNIAEIIQRVRPDILLLNEFDYTPDTNKGIQAFIDNYLLVSQNGQDAINYPHFYLSTVNTGVATPFDLDNNGELNGNGGDAFGFGLYPGQYGMVLLSKFPIDKTAAQEFQLFKWRDMPNALAPQREDGSDWYSPEEWQVFRLSSKSHWDVPVKTPYGVIHMLAAHPTPPTFDGAEDRNGKRNHDEIRFLNDYIKNENYILDDQGHKSGLDDDKRFVVLGDLNSSPNEGDSIQSGIQSLLDNPKVNANCIPTSNAGKLNKPKSEFSSQHTAAWGLRVDYVIPSTYGVTKINCGMFWPSKDDALHYLIATRKSSSDHRLVWADLTLQ